MLNWWKRLVIFLFIGYFILVIYIITPNAFVILKFTGFILAILVTIYGIGITVLGSTPKIRETTFLYWERRGNQVAMIGTWVAIVIFEYNLYKDNAIGENPLLFGGFAFLTVLTMFITYLVKIEPIVAKKLFLKIAIHIPLKGDIENKSAEPNTKVEGYIKDDELYVSVFIFNGLAIMGLFATYFVN